MGPRMGRGVAPPRVTSDVVTPATAARRLRSSKRSTEGLNPAGRRRHERRRRGVGNRERRSFAALPSQDWYRSFNLMIRLLSERRGLRYNDKVITAGAQTERRGDAGPVRVLLGGGRAPAALFAVLSPRRRPPSMVNGHIRPDSRSWLLPPPPPDGHGVPTYVALAPPCPQPCHARLL